MPVHTTSLAKWYRMQRVCTPWLLNARLQCRILQSGLQGSNDTWEAECSNCRVLHLKVECSQTLIVCARSWCLPFVDADHFRWQKHLLSLKDHQGNTALHLAVIEGMAEPVQVLLQAGANINTPGLLSFMLVLLWGRFGQMSGSNCSFVGHLDFHVQMVGHGLSRHVAMWTVWSWSACHTTCTSMQEMKQHNTGTHECFQSDATAGVSSMHSRLLSAVLNCSECSTNALVRCSLLCQVSDVGYAAWNVCSAAWQQVTLLPIGKELCVQPQHRLDRAHYSFCVAEPPWYALLELHGAWAVMMMWRIIV